jgi:hypothetical protein
MKLHPTRFKQYTKGELRGRMMTEIIASPRGKRVLCECQEALDRPANGDEGSRKLVLTRYASELDIFTWELEDLLNRIAGDKPGKQ